MGHDIFEGGGHPVAANRAEAACSRTGQGRTCWTEPRVRYCAKVSLNPRFISSGAVSVIHTLFWHYSAVGNCFNRQKIKGA